MQSYAIDNDGNLSNVSQAELLEDDVLKHEAELRKNTEHDKLAEPTPVADHKRRVRREHDKELGKRKKFFHEEPKLAHGEIND